MTNHEPVLSLFSYQFIQKPLLFKSFTRLTCEEILVSVGRKPNTDELGLETVGLKPGDWLEVDDTCLVNGVEAVGDRSGCMQLVI